MPTSYGATTAPGAALAASRSRDETQRVADLGKRMKTLVFRSLPIVDEASYRREGAAP